MVETISDILQVYKGSRGKAIIFTETKRMANELVLDGGLKNTAVLHGDIAQKQRDLTINSFRDGNVKCLVATNVAARGLDISDVDLVLQCEPPSDIESYIHRSGRTGRAGRSGVSICLYNKHSAFELRRVEREAGIEFERIQVPSQTDVMDAAVRDTVEVISDIDDDVAAKYQEHAKSLLEKYESDAVSALSACLALMTDGAGTANKSLLTGQKNATTMQLTRLDDMEIKQRGFIFGAVRSHTCVQGKIRAIRLSEDRKSLFFDIPSDVVPAFMASWKDSRSMTIEPATKLPELLQHDDTSSSMDSRGSSNRGGNSRRDFRDDRGSWSRRSDRGSFMRGSGRHNGPRNNDRARAQGGRW